MRTKLVGVVDLGVGNISSVSNLIKSIGWRPKIVSKKDDLQDIDVILLPGVGAFYFAMQTLIQKQLEHRIYDAIQRGCPVIGICLGMQLFAESSDEFGLNAGLKLVPGQVRRISTYGAHIGWNDVNLTSANSSFQEFNGEFFYFNHSYWFDAPSSNILAVTKTAMIDTPIPSIISSGNILGFQFHPEKSQRAGRSLMNAALKAVYNG